MRSVAIRHDASIHIRGRIVTDRSTTHEKRIRVGRALTFNADAQNASIHIRGRIVTDRNTTHKKRIRVGRALTFNADAQKNQRSFRSLLPP